MARIRNLAFQTNPFSHLANCHLGDRINESLRVGVSWLREELLHSCIFHDPAHIHHRDHITHQPHNRQTMRDEQICQAK